MLNEQEKQKCVKEVSASCSKFSFKKENCLRQGLALTKLGGKLPF